MHIDSLFIGLKLHNEQSDIYVVILDLDAFAAHAQFFYFLQIFWVFFMFSSFMDSIPFVIQLAKEI